jgi:hypothetical protein
MMKRKIHVDQEVFLTKTGGVNYVKCKVMKIEKHFYDVMFIVDYKWCDRAFKLNSNSYVEAFGYMVFFDEKLIIEACRQNLMSKLSRLKSDAKMSIEKVKDFREMHWDRLKSNPPHDVWVKSLDYQL